MRTPFLDSRLIEFCGTLSSSQKLATGWTKRIMRNAIANNLPARIVWRKDKKGFSLPHDTLMLGPWLKPITETLSNDSMVVQKGFVSSKGLGLLLNRYRNKDPLISFKDVLNIYTLERWLRLNEQFISR